MRIISLYGLVEFGSAVNPSVLFVISTALVSHMQMYGFALSLHLTTMRKIGGLKVMFARCEEIKE
jgi:hypothetical protein